MSEPHWDVQVTITRESGQWFADIWQRDEGTIKPYFVELVRATTYPQLIVELSRRGHLFDA